MVKELANAAEYDAFIESHSEGLALICFTVAWSGPCRQFKQEYDKLAEEYDNVAFARIDSEKNDKIAHKEGVELVPAFCFYKDGQKVGNTVRGNSATLKATIDSLCR